MIHNSCNISISTIQFVFITNCFNVQIFAGQVETAEDYYATKTKYDQIIRTHLAHSSLRYFWTIEQNNCIDNWPSTLNVLSHCFPLNVFIRFMNIQSGDIRYHPQTAIIKQSIHKWSNQKICSAHTFGRSKWKELIFTLWTKFISANYGMQNRLFYAAFSKNNIPIVCLFACTENWLKTYSFCVCSFCQTSMIERYLRRTEWTSEYLQRIHSGISLRNYRLQNQEYAINRSNRKAVKKMRCTPWTMAFQPCSSRTNWKNKEERCVERNVKNAFLIANCVRHTRRR